jgi:hypothetical protein
MSLQSSKSTILLRKRDASPFLDAALEFLFAIVEREIQKKEPAFLAPSIHEFYTLSLRVGNRKTRTRRGSNRNRNPMSPTCSPALMKLLRYALGSKLAQIRTKSQVFLTCLYTVLLALLAYGEFLRCMDVEFKGIGETYGALAWYFSHYFLPKKRETFLAILKHQVIEKRSAILQTFPCKPSLASVTPCLIAMQSYFLQDDFQMGVLPALYQAMK